MWESIWILSEIISTAWRRQGMVGTGKRGPSARVRADVDASEAA